MTLQYGDPSQGIGKFCVMVQQILLPAEFGWFGFWCQITPVYT